jgi:hypothetical protein
MLRLATTYFPRSLRWRIFSAGSFVQVCVPSSSSFSSSAAAAPCSSSLLSASSSNTSAHLPSVARKALQLRDNGRVRRRRRRFLALSPILVHEAIAAQLSAYTVFRRPASLCSSSCSSPASSADSPSTDSPSSSRPPSFPASIAHLYAPTTRGTPSVVTFLRTLSLSRALSRSRSLLPIALPPASHTTLG